MIPELDTLSDVRILVVGDLMLDEYFYGDVERISPEAPVPVVQSKYHETRVGGAGSVVTNLAAGMQMDLSHVETMTVGSAATPKLGALLGGVMKRLALDY